MTDPTLTTGLLAIATGFASTLVGIAAFVAKRIVRAFDAQTAHLGRLVTAVELGQKMHEKSAAEIAELRDALEDRRLSEATEAMKDAAARIGATGPQSAISGEIAEAPQEAQPRARAKSSPGLGRR